MKDKTIKLLKNEITLVDPNDFGEAYPYIPADDEDIEKIATEIDKLYTEPVSEERIEELWKLFRQSWGLLSRKHEYVITEKFFKAAIKEIRMQQK